MNPPKMVIIFHMHHDILEIIEYAKYLGLDINTDQDLLWIAVEGLKAPVPEPWRAI